MSTKILMTWCNRSWFLQTQRATQVILVNRQSWGFRDKGFFYLTVLPCFKASESFAGERTWGGMNTKVFWARLRHGTFAFCSHCMESFRSHLVARWHLTAKEAGSWSLAGVSSAVLMCTLPPTHRLPASPPRAPPVLATISKVKFF